MHSLTSYALKLLARRAYTTAQISKKLNLYAQKGRLPLNERIPAIQETLFKLSTWKYLDDQQFAEQFIRSRLAIKPKSLRAIEYELQRKGVSKTIIHTATIAAGIDDHAAAKKIVELHEKNIQRVPEEKRRAKVYRLLRTRGFTSSITTDIMRTFFD